MRTEALEKWHVPQIFASLPLLLQAALLLFFIGIVDFLSSLSKVIAIPVGVAVALTVLFLTGTTLLPTLQCFTVSLRRPMSNTSVPLPCAYKSPQSLAFRRLVTHSRRAFILVHEFITYSVYILTIALQSARSPFKMRMSDYTWKYRLFSYRAYLFWVQENWLDFDRTFLILRNEHFDITRKRSPSNEAPSQSFAVEPIYDSVRALAHAVRGNEHHDTLIFAAYHCFQDLSQSAFDNHPGEYPNHHLQACYRDLIPTWNSPIANIASIVVNPTFALVNDIHTVLFLRLPGIFYKAINPGDILGKHTVAKCMVAMLGGCVTLPSRPALAMAARLCVMLLRLGNVRARFGLHNA